MRKIKPWFRAFPNFASLVYSLIFTPQVQFVVDYYAKIEEQKALYRVKQFPTFKKFAFVHTKKEVRCCDFYWKIIRIHRIL